MITNRTLSDVKEAKRIRTEKIQKFTELTEEEKDIIEKGLVTLNTLNRIESKQSELKNLLFEIGYASGGLVNKEWGNATFFMDVDLQRIVSNVVSLREAFYVLPTTPRNPTARFHYEDFNNIEKILVDIETMIADMMSYYKECDTFYSGEE